MKPAGTTLLVVLAVLAVANGGEPGAADKRGYWLFHRTPRELMREMSTDRPDTTESPFTVDAGHLQIEMDAVAYTRDRHTPERDGGSRSWAFATANVKLGLTHDIDFQVVLPFHQRLAGSRSGFGDVTLRLKRNLWGNDAGATALALMPFVKLPTAEDGLGNDEVEAGLIIPFATTLPGGWNFGAMAEIDYLADEDGTGRNLSFVTSITFGHAIAGDLGGYVELVSDLNTGEDWVATFNTGLTYGLTEDIQLDAGINIGLTRAAEDLTTFIGISLRF